MSARSVPAPRQASLRTLQDPTTGEVLDYGLVLWFPAPASFSGEDVAELHMHGGRAVVTAMLTALARMPGLRPAEPGEFSRRAFLNGRLDLTAAEGLADLVAADTVAQQRQALRQMGGALGRLCESWREHLVRLLAHLEAVIDFPDEHLPQDIEVKIRAEVVELTEAIRAHLDDNQRGERIREGIHIVLVGAPNVGKSSLLNCLAGRDAAIVAATAGTTRDVIEVHMDLGGYPIVLVDTAGVRTATEAIEAEGVRRALAQVKAADLKLVILDGEMWPAVDRESMALIDDNALIVLNKVDLLAAPASCIKLEGHPIVAVSALQGTGLPELERRMQCEIKQRWGSEEKAAAITEQPVLTRVRHRAALQSCLEALERIPIAAHQPELAAEDLRLAARALGQISGCITVDEVLDVIFRDFCIGK